MTFEFEKNKCCYFNCNEKSIDSHAISKKISLQAIAEKSHLTWFSPRQNSKYTKKEYFQSSGVGESTISKSFCKKHDDIFQQLDRNEISTSQDIILQSYRMLSIVLNNERVSLASLYKTDKLKSYKYISKDDVISFIKNNKYDTLLNNLTEETIEMVQKKIFFEIGEVIDTELSIIEDFSIYLLQLYNTKESLHSIKINEFYTLTTENMEYILFYYKTDFQIPIAMNTLRKFHIEEQTYNYYFNIVPYLNSTIILGVLPKKILEFSFIVDKINNSFKNNISILSFIESVIASNDDWYIKPSIIESMSEEKKKTFLEDCMFNTERRFYDTYDISIFDGLRKKYCLELDEKDEMKKIEYIPNRLPYKKRYENMIKAIQKSSIKI